VNAIIQEQTLLPPARFHKRRRSSLLVFVAAVVLPTMISIIYYGFIATPRYVSEAELIVQADEKEAGAGLLSVLLGNLGGVPGGRGSGQAYLLAEYIKSAAMLDRLQERIDIQTIYSFPDADPFSRLPSSPTREEFIKYFNSAVDVELDTSSNIITVRAEAFTSEEAQLILQTLLEISEETLNRLTVRRQQDTISFAEREVRKAEERLKKARLELAAFRHQNSDIDPTRSATAQGSLIADLMGQLAEARAELTSALAFLQPDSTQIKARRARIEALEKQIQDEQRRLTADSGAAINTRLGRYEELMFEHEFAQNAYKSALTFLETSRASSQQQQSYIVDFVSPTLPQEATRPERVRAIGTTFVLSLLIWGIGTLLLGALRENSRI
jgi:capsular polysaccharide transport system permease protein